MDQRKRIPKEAQGGVCVAAVKLVEALLSGGPVGKFCYRSKVSNECEAMARHFQHRCRDVHGCSCIAEFAGRVNTKISV